MDRNGVRDFYANLKSSSDLKTTACVAATKPHHLILATFKQIPDAILDRFYGCGVPVPLGIEGLTVLDLGSGSGRDCYLAAALVGQQGSVLGVDMTSDLVQVSQQHAGDYCARLGYDHTNLQFVEGHMEDLGQAGVADNSVDLIISNCVINLCPNKELVFKEAYRVLKHGGEMFFSDMYATRRLSPEVKGQMPWGEGLPGALYLEDFRSLARSVGFEDARIVASSPIDIRDARLKELAGHTTFLSLTIRLFKLPDMLESDPEDYGQWAIYKGTIPGHSHEYALDKCHIFEAGKATAVSGNTAAMLGTGSTRLARHFEVLGERSTHFGAFSEIDYGKSPL
ncbi:hypothetical protein WJX73_003779 [Symbiochloris irregularis]|uniref:Arsenite methyltransferase n=1 Tax=Symbiochloris irregularis TaxID=706552 RepID=A0AAW1NV46_9CHLO